MRITSPDRCFTCDGTGYEIYQRPVSLYSGRMVDFAVRCSVCKGKGRLQLVLMASNGPGPAWVKERFTK